MKTRFYWECNGDEYPFRSDEKYLVYFKGGFTPCHRGHFETVQRFTKLDMDNIHVMIHQIGGNRHGLPHEMSREIWKTYIRELIPDKNIFLIQYEGKDDILDLPGIEQYDRVIFIRGNENYDIDQTNNRNKERFRWLSKKLHRMGVALDFYYLERPHVKTLCATEFTRMLIKTKRCINKGCSCVYKKLKYYFPHGLSRKIALRLAKKIQQYNLIV
jgi:hypothetical protein